jgi:uncharacterized protein (DUF342 family)
MAAGSDRSVENLIQGSERLIQELIDTGIPEADAASLAADIEANIRKGEMAALDALETAPSDARAEVSASEDGMIANATFFPPTGDRPPLDLDDVRAALDAAKVRAGIDWDAIKDAVLRCNAERVQVRDVVAARGIAPTSAMPSFLVISRELRERRQKADSPSGRIDFRELSPFTLVKKGDVLATWSPQRDGKMGSTVHGTAIAYSKVAPPALTPGQNTVTSEGAVLAACDGRFQATANAFWVDEVLSVSSDVDYHTGNIDFPGDVIISGDIKDGFTVSAGKSIFCMKSIDASRIDCKGDLVTNQGIIGRKQAVIKVGGILRARFVEGCYIDAGGSIHVQTSVMNSSIHTLDRVDMGERGIIVGGLLYAQNGVSAAQIGTERSPRTEIHCGVDFTVEQKLVWIRDKTVALAVKLKEIETRMKASPESAGRLAELREKIAKAIHQMNAAARGLVQKLDKNERAGVSVRETVFPGTYIEICHVSHIVAKPLRSVTFRLDKTSGKIVAGRWEKPPASD